MLIHSIRYVDLFTGTTSNGFVICHAFYHAPTARSPVLQHLSWTSCETILLKILSLNSLLTALLFSLDHAASTPDDEQADSKPELQLPNIWGTGTDRGAYFEDTACVKGGTVRAVNRGKTTSHKYCFLKWMRLLISFDL